MMYNRICHSVLLFPIVIRYSFCALILVIAQNLGMCQPTALMSKFLHESCHYLRFSIVCPQGAVKMLLRDSQVISRDAKGR